MSDQEPTSDQVNENLDIDNEDEDEVAEQTFDEFTMLKQRAKIMGISHSPNIGLETLRQKIHDAMEGNKDAPDPEEAEQAQAAQASEQVRPVEAQIPRQEPPAAPEAPAPVLAKTPEVNPLEIDPPVKKPKNARAALRAQVYNEAMKLVRIRITNMDPKKRDLKGEIITVANSIIGTVRKYVPFGEGSENGYHVPNMLYEFLKEREFLSVRTDTKNGKIDVKTTYLKEFAIEVLPPLTPAQLKELSIAQMAAAGLASE